MSDIQGLINHLTFHPKTGNESWEKLGTRFGFKNGECARVLWKKHRKTIGKDSIKIKRREYTEALENLVTSFEEDINNKTAQLIASIDEEIKTLDELIDKCKIDTTVWKIDRYIQNYWGNPNNPHWQVKAWLSKIDEKEEFQQEFETFLNNYESKWQFDSKIYKESKLPKGCLIINKQDEHLNKFDIHGDNDIIKRFINTYEKIRIILKQATISNNLDKIIYVIGSDEFNSEWTNTTTKGTPQKNILSYQEAFQKICDYETHVINMLHEFCPNVVVVYVSGNHDEYVGWHLISWLKAFFKNQSIVFNDSGNYRKYIKYGSSAIMLNHGDAIKAEKLAGIFPQEFKDEWSNTNFQYIFTGDKHHEISKDINGIKFYQLPCLSKAKSLWDEKNGYVSSKAELTAFMIDEENGMTNIYKQVL